MPARKMISMGLSMRYLGYHAAAWRHPQVDPGGASDFSHFLNVARLAEAGIEIARRTVAKYREGMGIPSSVERRRKAAVC